ncbi:MAG: hypothetical protein ACYTJ0_14040, partial [Planctomycetota bacterium]
ANYFRPGDFTGVRVALRGDVAEPTPIWVQVEVPNADGDIGEYGRALTLNPGTSVSVWLYVPLPPEFEPRSVLAVRIFEQDDGQRGREMGGARISPSDGGANRVSPMKSMIGVVSRSSMGLNEYTFVGGMPDERPPYAHEDTRVVFGMTYDDLPDRWEGLRAFEAIVWGDASPRRLSDAQVAALRRYIERGGHLVISLPAEGNPWSLGLTGQSRFEDLLPAQLPQKNEDVLLSTLLPVLSKATDIEVEFTKSVWVFRQLGGALDRIEPPWQPLIALEDGRVIAARRHFGFGHITMIGLDLADRQLLSVPEAVQADVIWNQILGRRIDTPSSQTLQALQDAKRLQTAANENSLGGGQLFNDLISMSEAAGRGLLTVFGVIVLYWLVAGPGGFYLLRHYKQERHAWIAFAAAAGVFTAAAWGIVSVIKPATYRIQHVTYLDILGGAETPVHRAASWFSLNRPGYRRTGVFIESATGQRDLLASWSPPELPTQPFPNPDRYLVDVGDNPADESHFLNRNDGLPEFRRPSRATATQLYAHWMGAVDAERWGGTIWQREPVEAVVGPGGRETLRGVLQHDLPGALTSVKIIWVRSDRPPRRRPQTVGGREVSWVAPSLSGQTLSLGGFWGLPGSWTPGLGLDLSENTTGNPSVLDRDMDMRYVEDYAKSSVRLPTSTGQLRLQDMDNYLEMLSFFNQLTPPTYIMSQESQTEQTVAFFRLMGRELDLSTWFTGPCLIVIGRLEGAANPIPLLINGELPEHEEGSLTIVRWILPLDVNERLAFPEAFPADSVAVGTTSSERAKR